MNISYVFMRFPEPTQTFAVSDIRTLQNAGHDVSVWCLRQKARQSERYCAAMDVDPDSILWPPDYSQANAKWDKVDRRECSRVRWQLIHMICRHCGGHPKKMAKALALVGNAVQLTDRLLQTKPDVVHCFWGHYPALVAMAVKMRSPSTPVTMFLGAYDLRTEFPLSRLAAGQVDQLFTHTHANLPLIEQMGMDASRFAVVHRGIPLWELDDTKQRNSNRILTVGRAIPEKGHQTVIQAVDMLRPRWPHLQCEVVGDGPCLGQLKKLANSLSHPECVRFHGYISRDEVLEQMRASQVFVSASLDERLPNVVKEAMWAGCGIVTGRTVGIEELLPHHLGEIVPANDPQEFANAIERQLEGREDVTEARRTWIRENFSAETSINRYVECWTRLVS